MECCFPKQSTFLNSNKKPINSGAEVNDTTRINLPRWHFIDFPHAFLIVFRIQCGEWIESMFECMRVSKAEVCIPIFITVFVIGNLVILNLFLALLLNSFSGDALQQVEASSNSFALAGERIRKWTVMLIKKIPSLGRAIQKCMVKQWKTLTRFPSEKEHFTMFDQTPIKAAVCGVDDAFSRSPSLSGAYLVTTSYQRENGKLSRMSSIQGASPKTELSKKTPSVRRTELTTQPRSTGNASVVNKEKVEPTNEMPKNTIDPKYTPEECLPQLTPLFNSMFDPESKLACYFWQFRCKCYQIVEHRIYETLLIFTILMSSIALVFEDIHLNSQNRSTLKIVLYWADVFFCVFFGIEMIMKVVAYGLKKYFTNWWCCLDFFIVTVSVISIYYSEIPHSKARTKPRTVTTSSSLSVLRVLRTMRALRPLRALSRFQGMRVVVDALMKAIPSIGKHLCILHMNTFQV